MEIEDDSSDEGESDEEKPQPKASERPEDADSDNDSDMFSGGEEETAKGTKPEAADDKPMTFEDEKPGFMNMRQFEDEVGAHKTTIDTEESDSDAPVDVDYYTRIEADDVEIDTARAKRRAPKVEAFNLREAEEEGKFDEHGNFVANADDENAQQDGWLNGVSKKDIAAAKRAQQDRNQPSAAAKPAKSKVDLILLLSQLLGQGETGMTALGRLGKQRKGLKGDAKKDMVRQIEELTEYCDSLLGRDMPNIYDLTKEGLQREYQLLSGEPVPDLKRKAEELDLEEPEEWVFRWAEGEEVHGPFTSTMMAGWSDGYFTDAVEVRRIGETTWNKHGKYV